MNDAFRSRARSAARAAFLAAFASSFAEGGCARAVEDVPNDAGGVADGEPPTPIDGPPVGDDSGIEASVRPDWPEGVLPLEGAIGSIHDPVVIESDGRFFLFATGTGILVRESTDLLRWSVRPPVFLEKPAWVTTTDPNEPNRLWAPDISFFGGRFHLYYSASSFGSNRSCIGHASKESLSSEDPWKDEGAVLCSEPPDDFNAIDPNVFVDASDAIWLAFGSFWSGLKMVRLDDEGKRSGAEFYALSTRPDTAVEAPFILERDGWFYLFQSVDACCRGTASTYKILVGRSSRVVGPYVDRDGNALLSGGGTLLVEGDQRFRGPGHNAVLETGGRYFNVYHAYDADAGGVPTLRIANLTFGADGWPSSAGP